MQADQSLPQGPAGVCSKLAHLLNPEKTDAETKPWSLTGWVRARAHVELHLSPPRNAARRGLDSAYTQSHLAVQTLGVQGYRSAWAC